MHGIATLNYFKDVRKKFKFLVEQYHYKIRKIRLENMTYIAIYTNRAVNRQIKMGYDIHDNAFYFYVMKGERGKYPEPYTGKDDNIIMFYDVIKKHINVPFEAIITDDKQYFKALELNAELLRKYGDGILRGTDWI
ncbi:MAG: hypothetical protein AB1439_06915 [candidate division FCPU426 bacterium]